jgi:hypothetical protein
LRGKLRAIRVVMMLAACVSQAPSASTLPGAMQQQSDTAALRSKFAHETDPVRKAKLLVPLGDAEFRDMQKEISSDHLEEALVIVRQYRDEANSCKKALEEKVADPEKHPNGFKQLQISLRQWLRRLSDIIVDLAGDEQKPFVALREDLEQMDRQLIHELFPRRPEAEQESQPGKPKS